MPYKVALHIGRWVDGHGFTGLLSEYEWGGNPGDDIFATEIQARQAAEVEAASIYQAEYEALPDSDFDVQSPRLEEEAHAYAREGDWKNACDSLHQAMNRKTRLRVLVNIREVDER